MVGRVHLPKRGCGRMRGMTSPSPVGAIEPPLYRPTEAVSEGHGGDRVISTCVHHRSAAPGGTRTPRPDLWCRRRRRPQPTLNPPNGKLIPIPPRPWRRRRGMFAHTAVVFKRLATATSPSSGREDSRPAIVLFTLKFLTVLFDLLLVRSWIVASASESTAGKLYSCVRTNEDLPTSSRRTKRMVATPPSFSHPLITLTSPRSICL